MSFGSISTSTSRTRSLRGLSTRFWNETLADTIGRVSVSRHSAYVDSVILPGAALFVSDHKIHILGFGPTWLEGVLRLLDRLQDCPIESLVYQLNGAEDPRRREIRKRIDLIRDAAIDRLGPAVVAEDTALFYPPQRRSFTRSTSRSQSDMFSLLLSAFDVGPMLAARLRQVSYAKRGIGLASLGLERVFQGFQLSEHHMEDRSFLCGIKGREYFAVLLKRGLSIRRRRTKGSRDWTSESSLWSAMFEFGGAGSRSEIVAAVAGLLLALDAKSHTISVLHNASLSHLPQFPTGDWQHLPLGLNASLSTWIEPAHTRAARVTA